MNKSQKINNLERLLKQQMDYEKELIDALNVAIIAMANKAGVPNYIVRNWLFERGQYRREHEKELREKGTYYTEV